MGLKKIKKNSGMPGNMLVVASVIAVILGSLLIIGGLLPKQLLEYRDPISVEVRSQNTNLAASLIAAGIIDPFVDIDSERAYVAYELPQGFDSLTMQRLAIGASANAVTISKKIVVVQYKNEVPAISWSLEMSDFKSFMRGEITIRELEDKIEKRNL